MRRKKTGISKLLFFIAFYVYMIVYTLQTSAFGEFIPPIVYTLTRFLVIGITIISILLSKSYRVKNFVDTLIIVLCLVGALGNYFIVGFAIPLEFMCLIITAKDIDFEWIINNYIRITLCILIVAFICSSVGMIPTNNIVQNGVMRYSFGMNYCTDFAAHIFYLILADNYIKFKKISFSRIFIYLVAAYVVYKYCAARLDTILILALVALDLYLIINAWVKKRNVEYFKGTRFLKILLIGAYPISSVLSLICAINYRESDFLQIINIALSYRIYYANQALNTYGYPLWGKLFEMVGSGTIAKNQTAGLVYFFVDNSYIYIMLRYEGEVVELKIDCDCRKPKPGMLIKAAEELNIDLSASFMVGDGENDVKAGLAAGCKAVLINGEGTDNKLGDYGQMDTVASVAKFVEKYL